jgi:hypothetical protein
MKMEIVGGSNMAGGGGVHCCFTGNAPTWIKQLKYLGFFNRVKCGKCPTYNNDLFVLELHFYSGERSMFHVNETLPNGTFVFGWHPI